MQLYDTATALGDSDDQTLFDDVVGGLRTILKASSLIKAKKRDEEEEFETAAAADTEGGEEDGRVRLTPAKMSREDMLRTYQPDGNGRLADASALSPAKATKTPLPPIPSSSGGKKALSPEDRIFFERVAREEREREEQQARRAADKQAAMELMQHQEEERRRRLEQEDLDTQDAIRSLQESDRLERSVMLDSKRYECKLCFDDDVKLEDMITLSCEDKDETLLGHRFCVECFKRHWYG